MPSSRLVLAFCALTCFFCAAQASRAQGTTPAHIPMDSPAFLYSPFNWSVSSGRAKTINPGAYFKVVFSGTSCRLATDTHADLPSYSQFWARVDGGPFTRYTLAAGDPEFIIATGLAMRKHILEVVIKSTSERIDRWASQATGITFTSLILDTGGSLSAPVRKPYTILIYGDSITEGVRVNGYVGMPQDTDRNDALQDYSWLLSEELPAEVGVVGFGATGVTRGGSGGVPSLVQSYALLWAGQPRQFNAPVPDIIIYNEGTNDRADITSGLTSVILSLLHTTPNARQLVLCPFNGSHAKELQAVVTSLHNPNICYGDTQGFFTSADASDALHPYGYAHMGYIAPRLAALILPLLTTGH